jgi:hypothetical protein
MFPDYSRAMRKLSVLLAFIVVLLAPAFAQAPAPKIDNDFLHTQFGPDFTLVQEVPPLVGDLNGDGVEDIVIAARCKNPLLSQAEHNYTVVDPYYDFYGFGDPKVTTTFSEPNPALRGLMVLIIHGAGPDGWRSLTPRSKFAIVNLPYRSLSVRKMRLHKRIIEAIYVEEAGETGESSAVYFDGKSFRYSPMGGSMQ